MKKHGIDMQVSLTQKVLGFPYKGGYMDLFAPAKEGVVTAEIAIDTSQSTKVSDAFVAKTVCMAFCTIS